MKQGMRAPKITEYVGSINVIPGSKEIIIEKLLKNHDTDGMLDKNKKIAFQAMKYFFDTLLKYEIDILLHMHKARETYDTLYIQKQNVQKQLSNTLLDKETIVDKEAIKNQLGLINESMKQELYSIKTLITESPFYTEVILPYEGIMNNNTKDLEKQSLFQIPYFENFYKTIGTLTQTQEKPDHNIIKKIFTVRNFIQGKLFNDKKQGTAISIFNKSTVSNNDIEKYYHALVTEEIKIEKPMKRRTPGNGGKGEIHDTKEPFKKSEAFIHLLRRLGVEDEHLYGKKVIIYFGNEFAYHATFFSFYLEEINGSKVDKTVFLFNPDVTSGEPNRSTYFFQGKVALEKLYEIEGSLKDFLTQQLNATAIKQTKDKLGWEKRIADSLFEPREDELMEDSKILTKIYYYSRDYFTHFQEGGDEIIGKTKKEISYILDKHYTGINTDKPYNINFERLANASTYSLEAHKINKFLRASGRKNCKLLSMDYVWFRNLLLNNAGKDIQLTLHNDNIERYLIAGLRPCDDAHFTALLHNKTNDPKIKALFTSLEDNLKNQYLFKQRVTQFNRDEKLVEQYGFLNESLAGFKNQYEKNDGHNITKDKYHKKTP